jgi:tetratricopeptide (TPR) repeat protein
MAAMTDDMPARVRAALHNVHTIFDYSGTPQEIIEELELALRLYQKANDPVGIADAYWNIAAMRLSQNPQDAGAWQMLQESITMAEAANDSLVANCARASMSFWTQALDRFDEAETMAREGVQRCRETGDLANLSIMLFQLGHCLADQLRFEEAIPCFEEAVEVARDLKDPVGEMRALGALAEVCRFAGDLPRSLALNAQAVALGEAYVPPIEVTQPMVWQAKALNDAGEHDAAYQVLLKVTRRCVQKNLRQAGWYLDLFDAFTCVYSGQGSMLKAARIAGAADRCLASMNRRRLNHNIREYAPYIAKARAALGDDLYEATRAEGSAMTLDEAIAFVLDEGN